MRLGHREKAEAPFQQALAIRVRVLGENHLDVARVLNNMGGLLTQMGRFDDAIAAHRRALAIQRRAAPNGNETYPSFNGFGMLEMRRNDFAGALDSFRQAQSSIERKFGQNNVFFGDSLYNVALALEKLKRFEEAQRVLEQSLEIRKQVLPLDHADLAFNYHSLGRVLEAQGKLKLALASYEEGVRIRKLALGPDHPRTANLVASLGMLQARLGDVATGQRLLEQSFRTNLRAYGPNDEDTLEIRKSLVRTLVLSKQYDEAIRHLREMTRDDVSPALRVALRDPDFAEMRKSQSFRQLEAEWAGRGADAETRAGISSHTSDRRLP
jgi:tetratricopeptide (TPR) repeat protein